MKTTRRKPPEARLATYWRARTGLAWSDFDIFDPTKSPPKGTSSRPRPIDLKDKEITLAEYIRDIAFIIAGGFPLSFQEFHVALATGFLMSEVPYETYFKKFWYENAESRGYDSDLRQAARRAGKVGRLGT
jgi:hypothetical protein